MANELLDNSRSRNGATVLWITYHTAEGGYDSDPADVGIDAGSADSLIQFFRNSIGTSDPKSSHAIADDDVIRDNLVPYDRAAFTLRNGNAVSDNLEQMGLAKWTRQEWLTHDGLLWNAAEWGAKRAKARGWSLTDIRHLSVAEVAAKRARGFIAHVDYTNATGDGTHWDCGPNYPMDVVVQRARLIFAGQDPRTTPGGFLMALSDSEQNEVLRGARSASHTDLMLSQNNTAGDVNAIAGAETSEASAITALSDNVDAVHQHLAEVDSKLDQIIAALGTPPA